MFHSVNNLLSIILKNNIFPGKSYSFKKNTLCTGGQKQSCEPWKQKHRNTSESCLYTMNPHFSGSFIDNDYRIKKNQSPGEFPGDPVVRTWCFHCCGPGSIPGPGTKIPASHAGWLAEKTKQPQKQTTTIPSKPLILKKQNQSPNHVTHVYPTLSAIHVFCTVTLSLGLVGDLNVLTRSVPLLEQRKLKKNNRKDRKIITLSIAFSTRVYFGT